MELMLAETDPVGKFVEDGMRHVADELQCWDMVTSAKVEPVEHESRSGFIATTNGGWHGTAYIPFMAGKDSFNCLADMAASDNRECMAEFRSNMTPYLKGEAKIPGFIPVEFDLADIERPGWNAYYEGITDQEFYDLFSDEDMNFAAEWSDGWEQADDDTFFLYFRAIYYDAGNNKNLSGEPEVYFYACVNTDLNYGHDNIPWLAAYGSKTDQAEVEFERNVKLADLTAETVAEVTAAMLKFLREA